VVLLQIASTVAATYWWMALPQGLASGFALLYLTATVLSAITAGGILFRSLLQPRRPPSAEVESWMRTEADALEQVVGGGNGFENIRLYRGSANGAEVEAIRTPEGAGIRVGEGLPDKLQRFSNHFSGGPRRVRTLIRFMLLHELGHLLNGDHLAYQFARAVLLAQLWVLAPVLVLQPLAVVTAIRGARPEELAAIGGMGLLLGATTMTVFFQRIIATRFASARERLADWRATVTLASAERTRLLHVPLDDSSFLEKALSALRPRPMSPILAALLTLAWPQSERIDARVRQLIAGHSKGRHEPLLWSGLAGANVGTLVVLAISLAGPLAGAWGKDAAQAAVVGIAVVLATLPAAILVGRADPTDPFSNESTSWERRIVTTCGYLLAHVVVVIAGYFVLLAVPPLSPLQYTTAGTVILVVTLLVAVSAFIVGTMVDFGPAALHRRGELQMQAIPFVLGLVAFIPLSRLLSQVIAVELEYPLSALFLPGLTVFFIGCFAMQSKYALVRRLSPLGADRISDFVRVRVLAADLMADSNDIRRRPLFIRLTLIWTSQFAIGLIIVTVTAVLFSIVAPGRGVTMTLSLGFATFLSLPFWPTKTKKKSTAPTRIDNNMDALLALFQSRCTGPLKQLLDRLKPSIAGDLRNTSLRSPDGQPDVDDLRRAARRMELAKAIGAADITAAWIADARDILRRHVADGVVRAWRGGPPSAYWTAWAARLAAAAGDAATARSLAHSAAQLLPARCNNVQGILVAATVARLTDEPPPALRSANLRQLLRSTDSLSDVAAIASSIGSDGIALLRQTVRSRLWTTLHANSRRQLLVVLDILDAGKQLGEGETPLWSAAEERLCDPLIEEDETLLRRLGATGSRSPSAPPIPAARLLR
jgi:hypothetical protein